MASNLVGKELLFENDRIRVWDMQLEPSEASDLHTHRSDYVYIYVTPTLMRLERPGEEDVVVASEDGFVQYRAVGREGLTHRVTNVGDELHRQIIVELLGESVVAKAADPETNERRVSG